MFDFRLIIGEAYFQEKFLDYILIV